MGTLHKWPFAYAAHSMSVHTRPTRNSAPLHVLGLRLRRNEHAKRLLGHAEAVARVDGRRAELLLNAQQLVVLGEALGAARRASLDLARLEANGEVGDERILSLARPVRRHHTPARAL